MRMNNKIFSYLLAVVVVVVVALVYVRTSVLYVLYSIKSVYGGSFEKKI
jgi:hypothetical protein